MIYKCVHRGRESREKGWLRFLQSKKTVNAGDPQMAARFYAMEERLLPGELVAITSEKGDIYIIETQSQPSVTQATI